MEETDNATSPLELQDSGRDEYLAKWEIAILTNIFAVTVIGNLLVLLSLYIRKTRDRRKITRMYFFIMHLSIADLLTGILDVLPQLAWDITFRFQGGFLLCKVVKFLQPLGPYLSSYVLTMTAIDRYHAICHPLNYCSSSSRRSRIMVYCAWIIAIVLCVPQVFVFSYQEVMPNVWDCWATFELLYGERIYVTWYSITVFILPFVVLVYTYTAICIGIWKSNKMSEIADIKRQAEGINFSQRSHSPVISKAMINTIKQTITVITLYVVTSTPFIGCLLWATWDPTESSSSFIKGPAFTILTLLSSLTSCVNPWIYLTFNRDLRSSLVNYFCKRNDYSLTYDKDVRRSNSNETASFISRMSRYAGSAIFR